MSAAGGKTMRVGFIGLGVMGEPMARHLRAAGHALAVWARRPESAAALVAEGVALPAAAAAAQLFNGMLGCGMGDEDSVAMLKLLERMSGGVGE